MANVWRAVLTAAVLWTLAQADAIRLATTDHTSTLGRVELQLAKLDRLEKRIIVLEVRAGIPPANLRE